MPSATQRIRIEGTEYDASSLSQSGLSKLAMHKFTSERLEELNNQLAVLTRAKHSYVDSVKQEILSNKTGLLFDED